MESDYSLETLTNKILQGMSLKELEAKIHEGALADVSRSKLFDILMGWFNEQIKQDIVTQSQPLLQSFVELLHMHSHANIGPFNLTQVDEVFDRWLEEDAVQNPAYRRRYLITQQDVHLLFSKETRHLQNSAASPPLDSRRHREGNRSPALSCEREDNNVGVEKASAHLPQNAGDGTPPHATQRSRSPTEAEINEIEKPGPSDKSPNRDTNLQGSGVDGAATTFQETLVKDSPSDAKMRRKATRCDRRSHKYKVHDLDLSIPPKNYTCRRCQEPGHWIQHCPTNLDPSYDSVPAHDYRCNFCGRKGNHFATLCSKNPYEGSLAKQREHAVAETREPRTPARSSRRRYQHQEPLLPPATRPRDRYRSHSPKQRARSRYRSRTRSRTPEYRRLHRGETDDYNTHSRNQDDRSRRRYRDESDVSPYTARARLTREFHMTPDDTRERDSSSRSWSDPFRFKCQSTTSPSLHRHRSPSRTKGQREHRDLDKVTKTDEGRLTYDDEGEIGPKSSPCSLIASPQRRVITGSIDGGEVVLSALASMAVTLDDPEQIEMEANDFLRILADEIMLKDERVIESIEANAYEDELEFDVGYALEDRMEGSSCSDTAIESKSPTVQTTPGPTYRLVQCPPFCPKVVFLFHTRENPIINSKANRKTACQMMEKSENFQTRHSEQMHRTITIRPSKPVNNEEENGKDCG